MPETTNRSPQHFSLSLVLKKRIIRITVSQKILPAGAVNTAKLQARHTSVSFNSRNNSEITPNIVYLYRIQITIRITESQETLPAGAAYTAEQQASHTAHQRFVLSPKH